VVRPPRENDHRELDVLVGPLVELPAVAALQQLAEAGDLAQRLLQVVAGHVGELLQVAVGPLEVAGLVVEALVDRLDVGQVPQDVPAHRVDVLAELQDLPRAVRLDLAPHVAGGDLAHLGGQLGHRVEHLAAQPEPGGEQERGQHDHDADADPEQEARRAVQS
jgi:hypothetical protein